MGKWLYFHVFDDDIEVIVCCIKEKNLIKKDLTDFDAFLAYYSQNYKVRRANCGTTHTCADMKCMRKHIIDLNISR